MIAANPDQLASYRSGKETLFGFFVGQVIKASKGKANPKVVNERLRAKLQSESAKAIRKALESAYDSGE